MEELNFDINKIKRRMLRKYPVFGSVINTISYNVTNQIETAGTDGKNIYFNPNFMRTLSEDEQVFIFSHEVCHIALNHVSRRQDKDKKLWNIATDAVINQHLVHDGLPMVEGGVDIKDALNYDAEELYNKLLNEQTNDKDENLSAQINKKFDDKFKSHSLWGETLSNEENDEQKNGNQTKNSSNNNARSEKDIFNQNEEEKIKIAENIMDKLKTNRKGYGNSAGFTNLGNVGRAKPVTNWKKLLLKALDYEDEQWGHKFSNAQSGYVARIEDVEKDEQVETEIILDVSGSVNKNLLINFLKQVKNILKNSKIKIGTFSSKFHGFREIKKESDIDNLVLPIGGGTNFDSASKAFSKQRDINKICFTDGVDNGDAEIKDKRKDIVWLTFKNKDFKPDFGKVIYVPEESLEDNKKDKEKFETTLEL